ncbi:MAG: bifunctional 4-hydroxy-2-oxoglutarate aldolase/2-dehydro-3-deoxy-phosphogluconate aldolase [Armatimonadetes bacterium]|nr:bifunctional 4-hydroxy-2-oxoglutarate aldolase/2-dehydro-3-deoxy-phosphogluconate aldolase [Armatimonadota bacterium]
MASSLPLDREVIAIVRKIPASAARATADALRDGGIRLLEVTMNTDGALDILSEWRERYDGTLRIGAGTVLDRDDAERAVAAGAEFLISPNLDEAVIAYGRERGVEVWPGVMTPSEIVRAWKAGASAVKVFPAGTLGPRYFKEVRAPLDRIPLVAVGGVGLDNLREFLDAGATAVGVGSQLVSRELNEAGKYDERSDLARKFVAVARGG